MDNTSLIVTIILGLFSIVLSVYFFIRAKDSEKNTALLLTEIKIQVNQLQKLSSRWLDKSINYFIQQHPAPVDTTIEQLSNTIISRITTLIPSSATGGEHKLIITISVQLCHSLAQTNYYAQGYLPSPEQIDPQNQFLKSVCNVLDSTSSQFRTLIKLISENYNTQDFKDANVDVLYQEIQSYWQSYIKSSSELLISKSINTA